MTSRPVLLAPYALFFGLVLPLLVVAGDSPVAISVSLLSLQVCGVAFALGAARSSPNRTLARPWWLISLSWLLLFVAGLAFAASGMIGAVVAVQFSFALFLGITCRLLFALVLLAGLISLSSEHLSGRARTKVALDAFTVMGGGFMAVWYFLLGPALSDGEIRADRLTTIVIPLSDLALILGVSTVLLRGSQLAARRPLLLMLSAMLGYLISDVVATAATLYPFLGIPARLGGLIALPMFLVAASAAEQCRVASARAEQGTPRPLRPVSWLPYVSLLGGFFLLAGAAARAGIYPWPGLVAGGLMMTFGVAARQALAQRENHDLALTDGLTGLANRIRLRDVLIEASKRSRRHQRPIAVLMFDLDGFKPVNDVYGHEAGDALLVAFAQTLRRSVRASDCAVRLGGDEFTVVLSDVATPEDACVVAQRILDDCAAHPVTLGAEAVSIRASIGVAVGIPAPDDRSDGGELLRRADEAMYQAKRTGSHAWRLHSPDFDSPDSDSPDSESPDSESPEPAAPAPGRIPSQPGRRAGVRQDQS